jgi:hypothetical protein
MRRVQLLFLKRTLPLVSFTSSPTEKGSLVQKTITSDRLALSFATRASNELHGVTRVVGQSSVPSIDAEVSPVRRAPTHCAMRAPHLLAFFDPRFGPKTEFPSCPYAIQRMAASLSCVFCAQCTPPVWRKDMEKWKKIERKKYTMDKATFLSGTGAAGAQENSRRLSSDGCEGTNNKSRVLMGDG